MNVFRCIWQKTVGREKSIKKQFCSSGGRRFFAFLSPFPNINWSIERCPSGGRSASEQKLGNWSEASNNAALCQKRSECCLSLQADTIPWKGVQTGRICLYKKGPLPPMIKKQVAIPNVFGIFFACLQRSEDHFPLPGSLKRGRLARQVSGNRPLGNSTAAPKSLKSKHKTNIQQVTCSQKITNGRKGSEFGLYQCSASIASKYFDSMILGSKLYLHGGERGAVSCGLSYKHVSRITLGLQQWFPGCWGLL